MKELRDELHKAIDKYGLTDERTIAIGQKLDKIVCQAQKLIVKEGLGYIEAIKEAEKTLRKEQIINEYVIAE